MKTHLFAVVHTAGSTSPLPPPATRPQSLIGAWRLVWLEEPGADGTVHKADCTGMLVFTREGRMSVQVMYREPQVGAAAGPVQYAQGGYEASFGRYAVDAVPAPSPIVSRARWCGAWSARS